MEHNTLIKQANTLSKDERLHGEKKIGALFTSGKSFVTYPLRVIYLVNETEEVTDPEVSVLVSVPKKKFKRAVKRNRIKRLIREAYRLNKTPYTDIARQLGKPISIAFIYLDLNLPDYRTIEASVKKSSLQLSEKLVAKCE